MLALMDSLIASRSRTQSATSRKNRPESSTPDKLKMRNLAKTIKDVDQLAEAEADGYSDPEIVDDPDPEQEDTTPAELSNQKQKEDDVRLEMKQDASEEAQDDEDNDFEDSPRQKANSKGQVEDSRADGQANDEEPNVEEFEDGEDVDEDEVIDAAERIFIRMAE